MAGGVSTLEPSRLNRENLKRPDQLICLDNKQILVDVSVVHPLAPTYVNNSGQHQLGLAEKKAKEKIQKYEDMKEDASAPFGQTTFVPFICETFGGLSSSARQLMKDLAIFASSHESAWTEKELICTLQFSIAVAIQRGNAAALFTAHNQNIRRLRINR
jgi:hypothetical protein